VASYTRQDAGRFREMAQRLPADYGKAAKYKGLKVSEILSVHAAQPAGKRGAVISQKTIKRHFSALSALWENAISKGDVKENIFKGFRFSGGKKATEQRDMWEPEELALLFASPLWTGCLSATHRSAPGHLVIRDEKFWLPLIAVFSGMRQEEICQLHIEDIKCQDGIWYFDINNAPPRQLKNDTAIRRIPLHSQLIAIGLLDFVKVAKKSGETRLFPELKPGGADGRLGHSYTKWFTRYRRSIKLYRKGLDFHSFRHSATTFLHTAGVQRTLIDQLTGHATPGETTRYTKRSSLPQLKEAIEALSIGVDLSRLCQLR
jgi:integrase